MAPFLIPSYAFLYILFHLCTNARHENALLYDRIQNCKVTAIQLGIQKEEIRIIAIEQRVLGASLTCKHTEHCVWRFISSSWSVEQLKRVMV